MEKVFCSFPFQKLKYDIYLSIEVMMNVDLSQALEFMFVANKEARTFVHKHYNSIKNGTIN